MKDGIHPKVNTKTKVICACGNSFETISTLDEIKVEICSACHPFYTGKQKYIDTEGRIEKFEKKRKSAAQNRKATEEKKRKKAEEEKKKTTPAKTLKEMLSQTK